MVPKHLLLDLHFDWEQEKVWGTTTYDLEVKGHNVDRLSFDAVRLEVSRVVLGNRPVDFDNTGEEVVLYPKKPFAFGDRLKVKLFHSVTQPAAGIYFTNPDPHYPDRFRTVWTQGQDEDSRYYFPCFDKPNFKQTTEVLLHLPPGMFGLSNGRLVKKKTGGSESLYHYKMELPYSTYLLSIVAGDFVEQKDRWNGVEIKWYVQRGREREGKNAFKDTPRMIRFFSDYTGFSYPYKHYTQIAVPEFIFGGMENFTVTTQTDLTLYDDRAALDGDSNGLVAHEAAHTWFGNIVTAKNWSHAWLHESFATYFDALFTRESKGENEFRIQVLGDAEVYFGEDSQYRRPLVTNIYKEPIDLFDAHLYPGGAVRLHHLKCLAGESLFREGLKRYLNRHQYGLVETVDFVRCLEEVTGRNFDEWLDQWIYRGGYPVLEVGYEWDDKNRIATVTVKQTQKADKKDEELLFKLPLTIAFYFARGEERFPVEIREKEERFCFKLRSKPVFFRLDPDYEIPCKKVSLQMSRPHIYAQLKKDTDPIGRIEAAEALANKPSLSDVMVLRERLLMEPFWGVAVRIAAQLGKIGGDHARDGLLKALKLKDPKTRAGVVRALGAFPDDAKAAGALKSVAQKDSSYRVEAVALDALGRVKDRSSRIFLEESIVRPSHNDMAQMAIYNALGNLEEEASWDHLVKGAEYGARKNSRAAAMRSLVKLALRYPHRKSEAIEHLQRFARESRGTPAAVFRGKLGAIMAMQLMDELSVVPVLKNLADNETDGRIKRRAEDAVEALFESARKPKEMKAIRSDLDDLVKENKALRERVDVIEKTDKARKKKNTSK